MTEVEECGWISPGHFQAFLAFIKSDKFSEIEQAEICSNGKLFLWGLFLPFELAGLLVFFETSFRVYTEAGVGRLRFIHHARLFGLNLSDIRKLLALADGKGCPSEQPEYREILRRHLHEIDERVQHLLGLRAAIEDLVSPARRRKGQQCSWNTCGCMQQHAGSPPPSGTSSFNERRKNA